MKKSSPQSHFDVIVLGVGCMGAAACMTLAQRRARVIGLEQFTIPNGLGSSGGESRIFRIGYYEHPDYVPLLVRARWLWRRIENDAERLIFLPTGGLWMGPRDSDLIAGTLRAAEKHGLAHEVLAVDDIRRRWPQFDPLGSGAMDEERGRRGRDESAIVGFYEQDAGMLLPENAIEAMVHLARVSGADIRQNTVIRSWRMDGDSIIVTTDHDKFRANRLIVTAGAWAAQLLPELAKAGASLTITRQAMGWYDALAGPQFSPRRMPCWARVREHDDGDAEGRGSAGFFYGFPLAPGARAIKAALHEVAAEVDPDAVDRRAHDTDVAVLDAFMPRLFRGEVRERFRAAICMYTNSPDGHFIVDRLPHTAGRVTIACGFSGHGFKFAPIIGEALADLAMQGETDLPIGFLSMGRFG